MPDKHPTYSKTVIEIADYIFANPDKKMSDVTSRFVEKCRKNSRTIDRYISCAKEYNKTRLKKQTEAKDELLVVEAKESVKLAILTRNERLEILSAIAKGEARSDGERTVITYTGDRIRAIAEMNKMQGDYAPEKIESSINFSDPFGIMRKINGIDE